MTYTHGVHLNLKKIYMYGIVHDERFFGLFITYITNILRYYILIVSFIILFIDNINSIFIYMRDKLAIIGVMCNYYIDI